MSVTPRPPERDPNRRGVEAIVRLLVAGLSGGLASSALDQYLAAGQEKLLHQYLEELATAQDRLLTRLGHVELQAFLARRETAAAVNQSTQIAMRTPSREKHRLLGRAALNAATTDAEDSLLPLFWSLVDRHSALEIKLLLALADPVNSAIRNGAREYVERAIAENGGPELGKLLFISVPELQHDYAVETLEVDLDAPVDSEDYEDDEDEWDDDFDPTVPPEAIELFRYFTDRLYRDGLIDQDNKLVEALVDDTEALETTMHIPTDDPLFAPDENGLFRNLGSDFTSPLGDRYLAFLTSEATLPPLTGEQPDP